VACIDANAGRIALVAGPHEHGRRPVSALDLHVDLVEWNGAESEPLVEPVANLGEQPCDCRAFAARLLDQTFDDHRRVPVPSLLGTGEYGANTAHRRRRRRRDGSATGSASRLRPTGRDRRGEQTAEGDPHPGCSQLCGVPAA
jgi:hypothetical protein